MIYFVSNKQFLFEDTLIKTLTIKDSLNLLQNKNILQFDTETNGCRKLICMFKNFFVY